MSLPDVGSRVYAMVDGPMGAPYQPRLVQVTHVEPNGANSIYGPWFAAQNAWWNGALRLADEDVLWTRAVDAVALDALVVAYALHAC